MERVLLQSDHKIAPREEIMTTSPTKTLSRDVTMGVVATWTLLIGAWFAAFALLMASLAL